MNPAYSAVTDDDYKGQLDIHEKQLLRVCNNDPDAWSDQVDVAILMTHHASEWLHEKAQTRFLSDIYPPGRFFSHMHGHLHEPSVLNFSQGGAEERRYRQGASLFGLKLWGAERKERIHGYTAGQFELNDQSVIERLWPRRLVKKMGGHWRLDPDISYDLDESNSIVTLLRLKSGEEEAASNNEDSCINADDTSSECLEVSTGLSIKEDNFGIDASFLADNLDEEIANRKLVKVPRLKLKAELQHMQVRQVEQAQFETFLLKDHAAWIIYDWGLAKESFIACIVERLSYNRKIDVFRLLCDDVNDFEEIELFFVKQFGLCNLTPGLKPFDGWFETA